MVSKSWLLTASCIVLTAFSSEPTTAQMQQVNRAGFPGGSIL